MSAPDPDISDLSYRAQLAMQAGRRDEAARAWEQVLHLAPNHPQALFHLGQDALLRKDVTAARELLERAAVASPNDPVVALNIAFVFRAMGDARGEIAALDRALGIDAYCYPALLAKGRLLERLGEKRQAARIYKDLLTIAPPDDQLPREMQAGVARARDVVGENARELDAYLQARLGPLRARNADAKLERFEACKDAMTGTKKIYTAQPTMLNFPGLPSIQYYDNADFPWLAAVEAESDAIREELTALLKEDAREFKPYVTHPDGAPLNQWTELNYSARWSALFLWKDGVRIEANCKRCPRTAKVIEAAPLARVPGYAPAVFFSTLDPKTRIPPHTGVTNTRLIVHLPLIVPDGCWFRVGNDTREWKPGHAWIFDDSMEHEAWNGSDQLRVILIFDIWNPLLSQAERELVCELLAGVRDYYGADYQVR